MKTYFLTNTDCQFVDRENETKEILYDIFTAESSKVSIIAANTAVGKSALSQKIFTELSSDKLQIRVKTRPENIGSNPNEWSYLEHIFTASNAACEIANKNKLTFKYFINNCKSKTVQKDILNYLIDSICKEQTKTSAILAIANLFFKKIFRVGIYDNNQFENDNSGKALRIKSQYINYVLKNTNVVLNIDNIQNIDYSTLELLSKWIAGNSSRKHYYLFEYTISEKYTFTELQNLQNFFSDCGVPSTTYMLKKLPSEYIVDLVNNHVDTPIENRKFNVRLLEFYNNDNTGNLRKLIDFSINYESSNLDDNESKDNPTLANLKSLSAESKYLVAILIYSNARILIQELQEISELQYISNNRFKTCLDELIAKQIIHNTTNHVEIKHASIIDSWNNASIFNKYNNLAYKDLESYLSSSIENKIEERWTQLLQLYSKSNPKKIRSLLEFLKNKIIQDISPKNAWKYLNLLVEETKFHVIEFKTMYFDIIRLCFECELYEEGFYCLSILEDVIPLSRDYNLLLNKCMFLSALDRHVENIELCEHYMKRVPMHSRVYLNLCLIVMASYRSTNRRDKCMLLFNEIESNKIYKNYIEYGYFLRLTCMYLPRKEGIHYIKKSISFFKRKREYHQAGKSLISYSYALACLKKYRKAYSSISNAERLLKDKQMGQHMFLVNKASILLSRGIYSEQVWDLLDKAEISATVPFDRLAIIVNKLICCIENKRYEMIDLLVNRSKNLLELEPDKHIHTLIYYNLYLYYSSIKKTNEAKSFFDKAYNLREWTPSMKAKMESKNIHKHDHEWYNCFLEYWTYDLFKL